MKLIFDSATEYFEFLGLQQQIFGGQPVQLIDGPTSPDIYAAVAERLQPTDELKPSEQAVTSEQAAAAEQAVDKPKRTRKPKASDAPMAEQGAATWPSSPTLAEIQAADDKPAEAEQAAAAQPAPANETSVAFEKPGIQIDPAKLAERVANTRAVDPAAHLTAARQFIARYQLSAYVQLQNATGLPHDIITYDDAQRVTHMAAMELHNEADDAAREVRLAK